MQITEHQIDLTSEALKQAEEEITRLRRRNEILEAKVETMHLMAQLFQAGQGGYAMTEGRDVLSQVSDRITMLDNIKANAKEKAAE